MAQRTLVYCKSCKGCGAKFFARRKDKIWCSSKCYNRAKTIGRRKSIVQYNKLCLNPRCKSPFSTTASWKKYCCGKCCQRHNENKNYQNTSYKLRCVGCNNSFLANRKDNVFCSEKCYDFYRSYPHLKGKYHDCYNKECLNCGKDFRAIKLSTTCCSDRCSKRQYSDRALSLDFQINSLLKMADQLELQIQSGLTKGT